MKFRSTKGRADAAVARAILAAGCVLALILVAGCSNLGSSGAEVRIFLGNENEGPGGPGPVGDALGAVAGQSGFTGEVRMRVAALIQDDSGFWTDVTNSSQELVFTLGEDTSPVELGRRTLAPGNYAQARLLFSWVEVHLTGAPPGFEIPADGIVEVQMGSGDRVTVTRNATLLLNSEESAEVVFDLNSDTWLPGTQDGTVPTTVFSSSVTAEVR